MKTYIEDWQRKSTSEPTEPLHNKGREDLNFEKTGGRTTTNQKRPSNPRSGEAKNLDFRKNLIGQEERNWGHPANEMKPSKTSIILKFSACSNC